MCRTRSRASRSMPSTCGLPGMLYAAIVQCPVFRRHAARRSTRRELAGMKGVRRVVQLPDAVAVVADSWWQREEGGRRRCPSTWDFARPCRRFQRHDSPSSCMPGLSAGDARVGRNDGDVAALLSSGQADRSGIRGALPRPRHHGAAELHGARDARPGRDLGADAGRRNGACHRGGRRRRAGRQGRRPQDDAGRRLRPARDHPGIRPPGGPDRQGGRRAGEAPLDPRGGHHATTTIGRWRAPG